MARSPILSGGSLSPFGSGGVNFGAFDIAGSVGEQAYLIFRRKEIEWEQGKLSNADYLTALEGYAAALPEGSEKLNATTRVIETRYRVERNALIADIESGEKEWEDLLAYDQAKLAAVQITDSAEYDTRLSNVRQVQQRMFSEQEDIEREKYDDGKITAAQLQSFYRGVLAGDLTADNPELEEAITRRLDDLDDVVLGERDARMISDFNDGKVSLEAFAAYATAARARYAKGTAQYDDWSDRLDTARDQSIEQSLTYRYGLSQRYDQLAKFVKDHGSAPAGGTSTSTSKRVIWTGSGWKTVVSTTTKPTAPSASEVAAWKRLQIEVADAKAQMAEITKQIGKQPGGWVTTDDMIRYYGKVQSKYVKGSSDWYNVQERLDSLNQQKHAEKVLRSQGITISYPKVGTEKPEVGSTTSGGGGGAKTASAGPGTLSGDGDITLDQFMKAIARVESGGRYDAVNSSSGAKGKYQIMPANWGAWAGKYLGNANAAWTPENQEKVARGKFADLYKWLGDWRAVAHWWLTGGSDKAGHNNPATWSSSSRSYVDKVFAGMGYAPTKVSGTKFTSSAPVTGSGPAPVSGTGGTPASGGGGVATGTPSSPAGSGRIESRSAIEIPTGLDGRQFERFYQRFLDAYENGDETFIDYSTGRPVSYFIPAELESRSETIGFLDEARVAYFAERARAYEGTASEEVAMTQYSDAIKKSGENQLLILSTNEKSMYAGPSSLSRGAGYQPPADPLKAINPLAAGLTLKQRTEAALSQIAAQTKRAWERGDAEMAYSLIQRGLDLAATNGEQLSMYYANAANIIRSIKSTGADMPDVVRQDMEALVAGLDFDATDGSVSPGYAKALTDLEKVSSEIEKFIAFDPKTDEPIRRPGATDDDDRFTYRPGVDLFLKPDGTIEHKQTQFTGWTDPDTPSRDRDQYITVSVKIGTSVKQVRAAWEPATIGFIEGTNVPIQGKLITGLLDGKEYAWVENPFAAGKWIRTSPGNPLVIKAPTGFSPIRNPDGSVSMEFMSGGTPSSGPFSPGSQGQKYRLEFNEDTGAYHVLQPPGLFESEWKDLGSASSSGDIAAIFAGGGWEIDKSRFTGDDAYFFNSTGAWLGFDQKTHLQAIRNVQSPKQTGGAVKALTTAQKYARIGEPLPAMKTIDTIAQQRAATTRDREWASSLPPIKKPPVRVAATTLSAASERRAGSTVTKPPVRTIGTAAQEKAAATRDREWASPTPKPAVKPLPAITPIKKTPPKTGAQVTASRAV